MRALVLASLACSTVALAGWKPVASVNGTPNDLYMPDAGMVVISSSVEVRTWLLGTDGGVTSVATVAGSAVGGGWMGGACAFGVSGAGNVSYATGCGSTQGYGLTFLAARPLGSTGLATISTPMASTAGFSSGVFGAPSLNPTSSWSATLAQVKLRTARIGEADFFVSNGNLNTFQVGIDGGATNTIVTTAPFFEFAPFSLNGAPAVIAVNTMGAVVVHPDLRDAGTLSPSLPGGFAPRRVAMGGSVGLLSSTSNALASPVPNPAAYAQTWRLRADAGFGVADRAMHCLDSRWCAVIDTANTIRIYENASAPVAFVSPTTAVPGQTVTLSVDAGDPDGDPLFHDWSAGTPATNAIDGDSVDFTVPLDAGCGPISIDVTTRDGLYTVVTPATVTVTGARGAVQVSAPSGTPIAGGASVDIDAFVDGGCESATFAWSSSDGQTGTGSRFAYQPPTTWCGGQVTVTLTATWASGMPSTESRLVQFTPVPWGAPNAPNFPAGAMQAAGTTQTWLSSGAEHACMGGGFPGTELLWDPIDAGVASFTLLDAGLQLTVPSLCVDARFVATARRQVVGETQGRVSAPATLDVALVANVTPLDAATNYQVSAAKDGGELYGDTSVIASCVPQRALESELTVFDGLVAVSSTRVPTPGPYVLQLPGGCSTSASLVARLFEDGGFTGASQTIPISLPAASPAIGALSPSTVTAACGQGVRAQLVLEPVAGACMSAETSWRVLSGPAVDVVSGSGATIDLQSTQLDLSMVGEPLVIEWSADAGPGNVATETRTVEIGVDPFVEVRARTTPLLRREESSFTMEVTLTNTTDCAVQGLEVLVPLSQAAPLIETARLDGARVAVELIDDALVLRDVALAARGVTVLQVAAKPKLLASPVVQPSVKLRGLPVAIDVAAPTPTGCGCNTTGPEWVLVALFAVARRRRRE